MSCSPCRGSMPQVPGKAGRPPPQGASAAGGLPRRPPPGNRDAPSPQPSPVIPGRRQMRSPGAGAALRPALRQLPAQSPAGSRFRHRGRIPSGPRGRPAPPRNTLLPPAPGDGSAHAWPRLPQPSLALPSLSGHPAGLPGRLRPPFPGQSPATAGSLAVTDPSGGHQASFRDIPVIPLRLRFILALFPGTQVGRVARPVQDSDAGGRLPGNRGLPQAPRLAFSTSLSRLAVYRFRFTMPVVEHYSKSSGPRTGRGSGKGRGGPGRGPAGSRRG
jgi:hypothetical protein